MFFRLGEILVRLNNDSDFFMIWEQDSFERKLNDWLFNYCLFSISRNKHHVIKCNMVNVPLVCLFIFILQSKIFNGRDEVEEVPVRRGLKRNLDEFKGEIPWKKKLF